MAFTLLLCVAMIGLVAAGKRRAWWLIGLAPVLALFVHRFASDPIRRFGVLDEPAFATIDQASFIADNDYVVGLEFNGSAYAYPFATLYAHPVIFHQDHDQRMVLIWSAFANRAVASTIDRILHARDIEIVSMPANSLLLYNAKLGQFIHGVTGRTSKGEKPTGFADRIPTQKMRWCEWYEQHPNTRVMVPAAQTLPGKMPTAPLRPHHSMHPADGHPLGCHRLRAAQHRVGRLPAAGLPRPEIGARPRLRTARGGPHAPVQAQYRHAAEGLSGGSGRQFRLVGRRPGDRWPVRTGASLALCRPDR
jgi:hypothetical protein